MKYHKFGTYYHKRRRVRIIDQRTSRGRQYLTIQYPHGGTEDVEAHTVVKGQPHPPRIFPPFTRRGYNVSRDRNRAPQGKIVTVGDFGSFLSRAARWLGINRGDDAAE